MLVLFYHRQISAKFLHQYLCNLLLLECCSVCPLGPSCHWWAVTVARGGWRLSIGEGWGLAKTRCRRGGWGGGEGGEGGGAAADGRCRFVMRDAYHQLSLTDLVWVPGIIFCIAFQLHWCACAWLCGNIFGWFTCICWCHSSLQEYQRVLVAAASVLGGQRLSSQSVVKAAS